MRRMGLLVGALVVGMAASARAQDADEPMPSMNMQAGPGGFSLSITGNQAAPPAAAQVQVQSSATSSYASSAEGYKISYASHPQGYTVFKVLAPEGLVADIYDGNTLVTHEDIPMSFNAAPDHFYRVVVVGPSGVVWEKKLTAKAGMTASLWVTGAHVQVAVQAPPPAQVVVQAAPAPAGPQPMDPSSFGKLVSAIKKESFSQTKLKLLGGPAAHSYFTIDQVGQIIDCFDFSHDKIESVKLMKGHVVDPQNAFQLAAHFDFDHDKQTVQGLFE